MKQFFKEAVQLPYDPQRPVRSFFQKCIRILYFSVKGFYGNESFLKASTLTFYGLISIVPILAIIFAVAKGFGFDTFLQKEILETFKQQTSVITAATQFAYAFIGQIESQAIAGLGVLFLFVSVFGLFENLEKSINQIWNVQKHRAFLRRAMNYFAALIIFPFVFIASTSITILIHSEIHQFMESYETLKVASPYVLGILKFIPYALMWGVFSYIYVFTPNTRIYLKPRILAGIIAGALFQFWQILYIELQLYITSYNVVYGSFAALPLFIVWMQVNFVILFFCAEIAAHIEGDRFFKKKEGQDSFRPITQKQFTLLVLREITSHFLEGGKPLSIEHISDHLGASLLDTREALNRLEQAGVIAEIVGFRTMEQYQLIVNPEVITIQSIFDYIDKTSMREIISKQTDILAGVDQTCANFAKAAQDAGHNMNLKDFAKGKPTS